MTRESEPEAPYGLRDAVLVIFLPVAISVALLVLLLRLPLFNPAPVTEAERNRYLAEGLTAYGKFVGGVTDETTAVYAVNPCAHDVYVRFAFDDMTVPFAVGVEHIAFTVAPGDRVEGPTIGRASGEAWTELQVYADADFDRLVASRDYTNALPERRLDDERFELMLEVPRSSCRPDA